MSARTGRPELRDPATSSLREAAGIITGFAILALVFTILIASGAQVGVTDCIVCTGNSCMGTDTPACPATTVAVVATGLVLAVESFMLSVGLSLRAVESALRRSSPNRATSRRTTGLAPRRANFDVPWVGSGRPRTPPPIWPV